MCILRINYLGLHIWQVLPVKMENSSVARQPLSYPFVDTLTNTNTTTHTNTEPAADLIRCDKCGFLTDSQQKWELHLKQHAENPPRDYRCDECDGMFSQKANMKAHRQEVHRRLPYPCPICSQVLTSAGNLKKHIQKTHGGLNVMCELCNTQLRGDVARHQRTPKCRRMWETTGVVEFLAGMQFAASNGTTVVDK
jgi:uncharacterized C2H2 Zn-finger protein